MHNMEVYNMKRILIGATLLVTLASLTACGSSGKTLTCTQTVSEDNGFSNEEVIVYKLNKNKIKSAKITSTIIAEGDYAQYIEEYKTNAKEAADDYNKLDGVSAKVDSKDNKVSVIIDLKADKMNEDNYNLYNMGESYESLKDKYSKDGYTCK